MFIIDDELEDIERRFGRLTIAEQFGRAFDGLPTGSNAAPLEAGDARVSDWKVRKNK